MRNYPEPETVLHRAAWVVPVAAPPIRDAGVLVRRGLIVAVGRYADLRPEAGRVVEHPGVIVPALVNCHAHLELSSHAGCAARWKESGVPGDMPGWIRMLIADREKNAPPAAEIKEAAGAALAELERSGTGAVIDIGNRPGFFDENEAGRCRVLFLREFFGFGKAAASKVIAALAREDGNASATGHALYSTHPDLLRFLKARADRLGHLFSIHLAESAAEVEFLTSGHGAFRDFLLERGVIDASFAAVGMRPARYLDRLGLLNEKTLCVHCVHLDQAELDLLARKRAKVCLCPGSNRLLGVGAAPLERMLAAGILPGLGTDSLASNEALSMWREMRILAEDNPAVDPAIIFRMATQAGAAIVDGLPASLLHLDFNPAGERDLYEALVLTGERQTVSWIENQ